MPERIKNYSDLPLGMRAFLESEGADKRVTTLANVMRFYEELPDKTKWYLLGTDEDRQPVILREIGRKTLYDLMDFHSRLSPEARQFLTASDPSVFKWLVSMRQEEVDSTQRRTRIVSALQIVAKLARYLFYGLLATVVATGQLGEALKTISSWLPWQHGK